MRFAHFTWVALVVIVLSCSVGRGDTVTRYGDGYGVGLDAYLTATGIPAQASSETTAQSFVVPGSAGTNTTLTFNFIADLGSYLFTFGFFARTDATADPIAARQLFATQALGSAIQVFDDRLVNPVVSSSVSVAAGTELVFFIVPHNTIAAFNAAPSSFYVPGNQTSFNVYQSPLFSISDANPGERDQFFSFVGNGKTLFAFEDLARGSSLITSDNSFTDLVFTIDVQLTPVNPTVPLPPAVWGGLAFLSLAAGKRAVAGWRGQ